MRQITHPFAQQCTYGKLITAGTEEINKITPIKCQFSV